MELKKLIILAVISVSLAGCARNTQGSFCDIYTPVYYDENTKEELKDDIDQNNVVYDEDC